MNANLAVVQAGRTKRITARGPFELKNILAALPGAVWDPTSRTWTYPATIGCAAVVSNTLRKHADVTTDTTIDTMLDWARRAVAARACRIADDLPDPPSRTEAWLHQRRAFHWGVEQEAVLLDMEMGTGKSKVLVDLCNAWNARLVLILAPLNMIGGWRKQFRLHSLCDYQITSGEVISRRTGRPKKSPTAAERIEALDQFLDFNLTGGVPVVVTLHYDIAWRDPYREWVLKQRWNVVGADEGHRIRSPGGKVGQFSARLRDCALGIDGARRVELTGTCMPHTPLDLYGQARFLEPALFGTSNSAFRLKYGKPRVKYFETDIGEEGELVERPVYLTTPGGEPIYEGVTDSARDELADKLASIAFHVKADEALDLPDELDDTIEVRLSAKTSKAYRELDALLVTEIGRGEVTVDNALTRYLRLAQITAGHLPITTECQWCDGSGTGRGEAYRECPKCQGLGVTEHTETIGTEKRDALTDIFADLPTHRIDPRTFERLRSEPVITFARFTHDLLSIHAATETAHRGPYHELSGGRRDALTDDSTLAPDTGVAGVQIQSGSEGVDFTLARLSVYYSLDFSLMRYLQSRARTRRPGADLHHPCEYRHLVAVLDDGTPTIDGYVYEALSARKEVVEYVHARMMDRVNLVEQQAA